MSRPSNILFLEGFIPFNDWSDCKTLPSGLEHQVQENTLTNIYQIRRSSHKSIIMTSFIFTKSNPKILSDVKSSSVELMGNLRVLNDVYTFRKFWILRTSGINSIKGQVVLIF